MGGERRSEGGRWRARRGIRTRGASVIIGILGRSVEGYPPPRPLRPPPQKRRKGEKKENEKKKEEKKMSSGDQQ